MRTIPYNSVANAVEEIVIKTNYNLPCDVLEAIKHARDSESSRLAVSILDNIIENAGIARNECLPICQDTGIAVFFVDIGGEVFVDGGGLEAAINEGTRKGYKNGALRMSIVEDPLRRKNTGDNTPAIIHTNIVRGDKLVLSFCPKGGGCENMSTLAMLSPGEGRNGIIDFVTESIRTAGGKPCPPLVVGIGMGGNFEYSAVLSKRALLRTIGERHHDPFLAELEKELFEKINALGIGPMGLGGDTTVLEVFVESYPCHIASMPLSVNVQCHAARHEKVEL
ncbi:fumarate hydratase [Candidatus Latescibacterota bacterium]